MAKGLAIVKKTPTQPNTKKSKQIICIETPPKPDWFVQTREHGRTVWYLRFRVTGMFPRRFGPFATRHKAILALDVMIDTLDERIWNLNDPVSEFRLNRRFQLNSDPVIEDEIALPALQQDQKVNMTILYDVMSGDDEGGQFSEEKHFPERGQFLASYIHSKREALQVLRKYRRQYPSAYLVKAVRTRCRQWQNSITTKC